MDENINKTNSTPQYCSSITDDIILRDKFAQFFVSGIGGHFATLTSFELVRLAKIAYEFADIMLIERRK